MCRPRQKIWAVTSPAQIFEFLDLNFLLVFEAQRGIRAPRPRERNESP